MAAPRSRRRIKRTTHFNLKKTRKRHVNKSLSGFSIDQQHFFEQQKASIEETVCDGVWQGSLNWNTCRLTEAITYRGQVRFSAISRQKELIAQNQLCVTSWRQRAQTWIGPSESSNRGRTSQFFRAQAKLKPSFKWNQISDSHKD